MWPFSKKVVNPLAHMHQSTVNKIAEAQEADDIGVSYHGGCHGCIFRDSNQYRQGIIFCSGCMYFQADWELPDLSRRPDR